MSSDGVIYPVELERYADIIEFAARAIFMNPDDAARLRMIVADAVQIEGDEGVTAAIAFIEERRREWLAERGIGAA